MVFAPRLRIGLVCLWLSIAMVLGHALAPIGTPMVKSSGSAFSASTFQVSLVPTRTALTAKLKRLIRADEIGSFSPVKTAVQASSPTVLRPANRLPSDPAVTTPIVRKAPSHHFRARAPPQA